MSLPTPPETAGPEATSLAGSTPSPDEPVATTQASTPAAPPASGARKEKAPRNTIGLIAFITAVVGFIFACIPGALIVGWVLLPIAFIMSLVSLFLKGKGKGLGITALILSIVGTIVGFVVFFAVVATSFDEAFSGGETTITAPAEELEAESSGDPAPKPAAEAKDETAGTREQPLPLGSAITQDDWTVTINSVNLNAADAIAAENQFNEPAPEGSAYVLVNLTATYNGTDSDGSTPFAAVEFVTAGGNTVESYESVVLTPNRFDSLGTLYSGASTTGNMVFTVPVADIEAGTLAVTPTLLGDKVFVAVK